MAYESQLKSDRAQWHRRLAAAIQEREPGSVEDNAALIAEHLEAAGELRAAYGWHMRAATWATNRDIAAARLSWERARKIADALPDDDPDQLSMRIAPRTMLCATDFQARAIQESRGRFAELRELCSAAGDKVSLAIGMSGLATELLYAGRSREGSRLASEQMALLESIGDPTLTMGLAFIAFSQLGGCRRVRRGLAVVADRHRPGRRRPRQGRRLRFRITAGGRVDISRRCSVVAGPSRVAPGPPRRRRDGPTQRPGNLRRCRRLDLRFAIQYGVLRADDAAVRAIEEAVQTASDPATMSHWSLAEYALGVALLSRDAAADRRRGLELVVQFRDLVRERAPFLVPVAELWVARERARRGDRDAAIAVMRQAVDELHQAGRPFYGVWGTGVLVETLLERGAEGDLAEAQEAIDRLANLPADDGSAMRDITLLRLRALLARAHGDDTAYRDYRDRYRAMATALGFEGHIAWAEAMP